MKTEQEYIEQIIELEKENNELLQMLEEATKKINELRLWQDLNGIKNSKDKKLSAFESRIKELESVAELSSLYQIHDYDKELALLTKRVISLRLAVDDLAKNKHPKNSDVASVESQIDDLSTDIANGYIKLTCLYNECVKFGGKEFEDDIVDGLLDTVKSVKYVIASKVDHINKLKEENARLKNLISEYSDNGYTIEELQSQLRMKDDLIANLKRKIAGLADNKL